MGGTAIHRYKEWKSHCSAAFFSRVPRRQKNVEHKLFPAATPATRAPRWPPGGRCGMVWWSFIVSLVSSKRMTCSSAMYSDTATLTLKYHIWRIACVCDRPRRATYPVKIKHRKILKSDGIRKHCDRRFCVPGTCSSRGFRAGRIRDIDIARAGREKFATFRRRGSRIDRERVRAVISR